MKIICLARNYMSCTDSISEQFSLLVCNRPLAFFMKPDSALLKDGRPFFIPDFSADIRFSAHLVVRICRLGKCIAARFARRYYDAVTVGVDFTAYDILQTCLSNGLPWDLNKCFDGSAVIGTFVSLEQLQTDVRQLAFRLESDGHCIQQGFASDMLTPVDEAIANLSQYMTLKMGDLIFTGAPGNMSKATIGMHLQGYLGEREVLGFNLR